MKKRLLVVVLMLFASIGFVACNGTTTGGNVTTLPTVLEQVDAPTNLAITGKVLSWTAVPNVSSYVVYVGGVEQATVSATSYDFNTLPGDRLIFQVVARGGQGVLDSVKSATVAYVANPTQEIADINAAMASTSMGGAPEGFAEELVRKGVIWEDFDTDYAALEAFLQAVEAAEGDFILINAALTTFLAALSNYEAYISAFMTVLPPQIESQIGSFEENIDYYEEEILYYQDEIAYWEAEKVNASSYYDDATCDMYIGWNQGYIDDANASIASLNQQILQVQNMSDAMSDHADEMTLAVTKVMEFFMDVQADITTTLLTNIQALAESQTRPTSAEIVAVKDEAVNILLGNIPSIEDLTLIYDLVYTMQAAFMGTPTTMQQYSNEMALQSRLAAELGLRFLLSLDTVFIDEVFRLEDESRSSVEMGVEIGIHVLQAVHSYEAAQAVLIATLEAVFTDAQRQAMYESGIDAALEMMELQGVDAEQLAAMQELFDGLTYAIVSDFAEVLDGQANKLFDYLALTDGEVLRKIAIMSTMQYEYNEYLNLEYANNTEYRHATNIAAVQMVDEMVKLFDATIVTMTEADVTALLNFFEQYSVLSSLFMGSKSLEVTSEGPDLEPIITALKTAIAAQDANVLALLGQLTDYAIAEDVAGDFEALMETLHTYNIATYGANYYESYTYDSSYDMHAQIILAASHINGFMTAARRTLLDGIVNEAFTFMRTAEYLEMTGMTVDQVNSMEAEIELQISTMISQATVIAGYNYQSLTEAQITEINEFLGME